MVIDLPHAFVTVAREVKDHRFTARVIKLGTSSEVVTLVLNPALKARIPAATEHMVDSMRTEMRAGRFSPPVDKP